jgi:glycosyltransferase involved in cell wall biosynthesis
MDKRISCLVISFNEESNIIRLLESLKRFSDVLVIDSGSSDKTIEIVSSYQNSRIHYRRFDTFANQCNFGLQLLRTEWVLSLDADYILTKELEDEISFMLLDNPSQTSLPYDAYYIPFRYCINGKAIRSGLLPPRVCLYRRKLARYIDIGHAHKVCIEGKVGRVKSSLLHDDRKSSWIWLKNQKRYQSIEASMLMNTPTSLLPAQDKLRKHTCFAPFIVFFICLVMRGGILDGKEGLIYAFQRLVAESLLFLELHIENGQVQE